MWRAWFRVAFQMSPCITSPLLPCSDQTLRCCVRRAVPGVVACLDVVVQHEAIFRADKTYTLIQRLAHNVIKTGLRKINSSYSRISLQDLCEKVWRCDASGLALFH